MSTIAIHTLIIIFRCNAKAARILFTDGLLFEDLGEIKPSILAFTKHELFTTLGCFTSSLKKLDITSRYSQPMKWRFYSFPPAGLESHKFPFQLEMLSLTIWDEDPPFVLKYHPTIYRHLTKLDLNSSNSRALNDQVLGEMINLKHLYLTTAPTYPVFVYICKNLTQLAVMMIATCCSTAGYSDLKDNAKHKNLQQLKRLIFLGLPEKILNTEDLSAISCKIMSA